MIPANRTQINISPTKLAHN